MRLGAETPVVMSAQEIAVPATIPTIPTTSTIPLDDHETMAEEIETGTSLKGTNQTGEAQGTTTMMTETETEGTDEMIATAAMTVIAEIDLATTVAMTDTTTCSIIDETEIVTVTDTMTGAIVGTTMTAMTVAEAEAKQLEENQTCLCGREKL